MESLASCIISNYDVCLNVLAMFKDILHGGMHSPPLLSKFIGYELVQKLCSCINLALIPGSSTLLFALPKWVKFILICCRKTLLAEGFAEAAPEMTTGHWRFNDALTSISNSTCRGNTTLMHPPKRMHCVTSMSWIVQHLTMIKLRIYVHIYFKYILSDQLSSKLMTQQCFWCNFISSVWDNSNKKSYETGGCQNYEHVLIHWLYKTLLFLDSFCV